MKIGCPSFGNYTKLIEELGDYLHCEIIVPPPPTQRVIELGNSALASELMCLPAKATLGSMIQACEKGATDLIEFDSCGLCRQKAYWILQQRALRKLGYNITVHPIRLGLGTPSDLRRLIPSISYLSSWQAFIRALAWILKNEPQQQISEDSNQVRIGLVGEIYTILEDTVNKNLAKKLQKQGAMVHTFLTLRYFINKRFHLPFQNDPTMEIAQKKSYEMFPKNIGGHGNEAITFTIYYALKGFDGVIHLMPMPCMPEATVSPVIDDISRELHIPVMRLIIDTHTGEAGLDTRLEAFVDILRRKKYGGGKPKPPLSRL
jgi:predicted nucleotide-binding protein (sugar kinase/HSP70/actin superfamily)